MLGSRSIGGTFALAGLGALAFFGSFALLYWNEGRADLSRLAEDAVILSPDSVNTDAKLQDQLVSVTGKVTGNSLVGDEMFLADPNYLVVERIVEMYAWDEEKDYPEGSSEADDATYRYDMVWTSEPEDDATFAYPEGHDNLILPFHNETFGVDSIMVGAYAVDGGVKLPEAELLTLTETVVDLPPTATLASSQYIFVGAESLAAPQIGDIRVSYKVLEPNFTGTVLGALTGDEIARYTDKKDNKLWRVFKGSHVEAVERLHGEFVASTWAARIGGFLLMWFGLASMLGIFSIFLNFIPVLGRLGRLAIIVVTFPIALALSIVTVVISMVVHSLVAVILVGIVVLAGSAYWLKQRAETKPIVEGAAKK